MSTIYRQAAIDAVHKDYDAILNFKSDGRTVADSFEDIINALPSAQPDYEKIIAEIKQCISETREHGKHHAKFVQDNGELYISGLEMALSIIEENI